MHEVTATIFRNRNVIDRVALDASMPQEGNSASIWIEVLNPLDSDFAVLQQRFRLHSLAVDDSMSPTQLPKLDLYDDQIFAVLKIARLREDEIKYADIDAFVGAHHIITVQHDDRAEYGHKKFKSGPRSMRLRPDFILHALMDWRRGPSRWSRPAARSRRRCSRLSSCSGGYRRRPAGSQ